MHGVIIEGSNKDHHGLQAPETGRHRRIGAEIYSPYHRNECAVYTQQYDSKVMFMDEDMQLGCEERGYRNDDNTVTGDTIWHIAYHSFNN